MLAMNLKVLAAMLGKLEIGSVCAVSGREALDILRKDREFQLVLTDLWMPEMDGAELAEKIHAEPATAQLPVVAVSADTRVVNEGSGVFQGPLLKPITLASLEKILPAVAGAGNAAAARKD